MAVIKIVHHSFKEHQIFLWWKQSFSKTLICITLRQIQNTNSNTKSQFNIQGTIEKSMEIWSVIDRQIVSKLRFHWQGTKNRYRGTVVVQSPLNESSSFVKWVFRTFLCRVLIYWFEMYYMIFSWHNTYPVRLLSGLTKVCVSHCHCSKLIFRTFLCRYLRYWLAIWTCSLLLVPQWQGISSFVFYIVLSQERSNHLINSSRSYASLFVGACRGHVLHQQYFQNACHSERLNRCFALCDILDFIVSDIHWKYITKSFSLHV